jgi:two-component system, LytTR family, response regulator
MRIVIIEDEKPAAEKLETFLLEINPSNKIVAKADSIKKSVEWLENNRDGYDMLYMDIQLTDGLSFDIFKKVKVNKPVIFTTAFNQYALEAFRLNGIDYLLKPITYESLKESLEKVELLKNTFRNTSSLPFDEISKAIASMSGRQFKNRFMVKVGEHIKSVTTDQISLFYAEGRNSYLITRENKKFILDYKMEELEEMLDPRQFFRVNRTFIVNISSISDVLVYSNSRLKITPSVPVQDEIIVSREKVNSFKDWFNGI